MSPMIVGVRQQVLDRIFGKGAGGFLAAAAVGWLLDQKREAGQPIRLDTAVLAPGETYLVTTRPAMSKAERKDARKRAALAAALEASQRPDRATRRTARKLAKAQRIAVRRGPESRKGAKAARCADELGRRFDALVAPSPKQLRLEAQVTELDARLAAHRADALAKAGRSARRRTPRTRTFT